MREFEKKIGYEFRNKHLLSTALCHSSYANESKKGLQSNERLEFLGDSVLSIVVSEYLYKHFSHMPEGELTKFRASLVCEKSLHKQALKLNLGEYLMLGKGEELTGGRQRPSILADAVEAVIAAIYLDSNLEQARKFILGMLHDDMVPEKLEEAKDYKTILQEIIQQNREEKITYCLVEETGPDHDKRFTVEVRLNSNVIGTGTGRSKKDAEQAAAREALALMGE
mgnify:FL=1